MRFCGSTQCNTLKTRCLWMHAQEWGLCYNVISCFFFKYVNKKWNWELLFLLNQKAWYKKIYNDGEYLQVTLSFLKSLFTTVVPLWQLSNPSEFVSHLHVNRELKTDCSGKTSFYTRTHMPLFDFATFVRTVQYSISVQIVSIQCSNVKPLC